MADKKATTQSFTQISQTEGDVVLFTNNRACLIFEITATNFELLSPVEQEAKIFGYATLLNSLSFPIQIVVRNKKLDITNYLKLLDAEILKNQNNLGGQIKKYREFVGELVKTSTILDKRFYLVLSFERWEQKIISNFKEAAISSLHTKASSLSSQLSRLNLKFKILEEEEIRKLFYDLYNEGGGDAIL